MKIKKIEFDSEKLQALTNLDDADVGIIIKAIATYACDGTMPSFPTGNKLAPFVFSLFKQSIEQQIDAHTKRCEINAGNANGKSAKGSKKRTASKKADSLAGSSQTMSSSNILEESNLLTSETSTASDQKPDAYSLFSGCEEEGEARN